VRISREIGLVCGLFLLLLIVILILIGGNLEPHDYDKAESGHADLNILAECGPPA
jgi:hypothetical protein